MKKPGIIVAAILVPILVVGLILGGYFWFLNKNRTPSVEDTVLTEVQKIITKDLEKDYPETPREVVKLFNRIITAYYAESYTDEELEKLAEQALLLFDEELQANNPSEIYINAVREEVADYNAKQKVISQSSVCSSNEVQYLQDGEDSIAYVSASYFIKEGSGYNRTYEVYVLRKDEEGKWKILVYYQVEGEKEED